MMVEARFQFPNNWPPSAWRFQKALAGGGALMDVGIYTLQASRYLAGEEPVLVSALESKTNLEKFNEVDETVVFQLKFPGGAIASCNTSYNRAPRMRNSGFTPKRAGSAWIRPSITTATRGTRSDGQEISFPPMDEFAAEMDDFADCIMNKEGVAGAGRGRIARHNQDHHGHLQNPSGPGKR